MKTFRFVRKDTYLVDVEAETQEEAEKKVNSESQYLNDGGYCDSVFDYDCEIE